MESTPSLWAPAALHQDGSRVAQVLKRAVELGASDVHLHSGAPVAIRLHGELLMKGKSPLSASNAKSSLLEMLNEEQRRHVEDVGELDLACTLEGCGRFRCNIYKTEHGLDAVFRVIRNAPASLADLGLPAYVGRLTQHKNGLVLVTGPAGVGKSSTLAALVDLVNELRFDHIITIEDPVEQVFQGKRSSISQRQIGQHTSSFSRALRAALREDPDVIVVGEMRDRETVALALRAAETGHLVLSSLHTNNSIQTVDRIVSMFPAKDQALIRVSLAETLRAVISQRLLPAARGDGRVLAYEILMATNPVRQLIRANKTFQLRTQLQLGHPQGSCRLDDTLRRLIEQGDITREIALRHCEDRKNLGA